MISGSHVEESLLVNNACLTFTIEPLFLLSEIILKKLLKLDMWLWDCERLGLCIDIIPHIFILYRKYIKKYYIYNGRDVLSKTF